MKIKNQSSLTDRILTDAGDEVDHSPVTIGLDLGDKKHFYCLLDSGGKVLKKETISNDREVLKRFSATWVGALIVMEAGTHSPWISRFFMGLGHRVIVANPRKMKSISTADRKSDERTRRCWHALPAWTRLCCILRRMVMKNATGTCSLSSCVMPLSGPGWA